MKVEKPENMTDTGIERLQRWAAFSVRAHRDLRSLAADLLLYDKLILPVPADDAEFLRWAQNRWSPESIATTVVKGAGRLLPVPWTSQLRQEFDDGWTRLQKLGEEVGYGYTGMIYASSPAAWQEISNSLQPDEKPKRKPALFAGYQSAKEARVELGLKLLKQKTPPAKRGPELMPGGRPVDKMVALHVRRLVHEPNVRDPGEAFELAISLVEDPAFQQARQGLFDWEDRLFVDGWTPKEAQKKLLGLQEAYRDCVRAHVKDTRLRWVSTLAPKAAGMGMSAIGHPHLAKPASWVVNKVVGHFISVPEQPGLERHPGAALEMIRAAYREQNAFSQDEAKHLGITIP